MALQYADKAEKTLTRAVPTCGADGNCKKWDVEVTYSLNGYTSLYRANIDCTETGAKGHMKFTKAELWALCPIAHWDAVYDSQYQSVMVPVPPVEEIVHDFDVKTLA